MKHAIFRTFTFGAIAAIVFCAALPAAHAIDEMEQAIYRAPNPETDTLWITPENPTGAKGQGGMRNQGAKGNPFTKIDPGETYTLLDIEGPGVVNRIWLTLSELTPVDLRSLRLDMHWDNAEKPAVSVPLGDFFGAVNGKIIKMETALFSSPEARSFNCVVPMPFRTHAKITLTNEMDRHVRLFVFEVNVLRTPPLDDDVMYFHAHWRRERWTTVGEDFEILPKVEGAGRFLGTHVGLIKKPENEGWWGEGEVKIYLDGDDPWPTLVGTGTEDYIGSGWGQNVFHNWYQGSLFDDENQVGFYRYHIPDPVYFREDCRVTIQTMGSLKRPDFLEFQAKGTANVLAAFIVSIEGGLHFTNLFEEDPDRLLDDPIAEMDEWVGFYREDDVAAVAFFYLDRPESNLPALSR